VGGSWVLVDAQSARLDDFDSATRAAAAGGVTTVMLMPTEEPRTSTRSASGSS